MYALPASCTLLICAGLSLGHVGHYTAHTWGLAWCGRSQPLSILLVPVQTWLVPLCLPKWFLYLLFFFLKLLPPEIFRAGWFRWWSHLGSVLHVFLVIDQKGPVFQLPYWTPWTHQFFGGGLVSISEGGDHNISSWPKVLASPCRSVHVPHWSLVVIAVAVNFDPGSFCFYKVVQRN